MDSQISGIKNQDIGAGLIIQMECGCTGKRLRVKIHLQIQIETGNPNFIDIGQRCRIVDFLGEKCCRGQPDNERYNGYQSFHTH
ncbi:MAG: hypothetical protein MAGBODY4_00989 [Candidatus Marinimicrobia bacterium]|nr:hypothetical protein [Candidatus Neomarinimicrobiota bacterium]